MSVDIHWEALIGGPDGDDLAETIRGFIHDRFQAIHLPKLIRSVKVHKFEFGQAAPEVVLKDICDPLPDFYDADEDDEDDVVDEEHAAEPDSRPKVPESAKYGRGRSAQPLHIQTPGDLPARLGSPGLHPGVLGTTSNLGYFHLPLSGTQTPLAAVAGAHFAANTQAIQGLHQHTDSYDSLSPPSTATSASLQEHVLYDRQPSSTIVDGADLPVPPDPIKDRPESNPEDLQVVFHVNYAGDLKLSLTAEVFLDYPMPSFVGIPLKLRITGLSFNGVGIVAYIKRKAHVCFLNPEDADALVGNDAGIDLSDESDTLAAEPQAPSRAGGLLEDIKIESEMGESESGKQVLKNVDKIEKFILEQVRRIFEDEFVYPSYWTFLV